MELDTLLLRNGRNPEIAAYIQRLLKEHGPLQVCNVLIAAVEEESIKPVIFSMFLPCSKSIDCMMTCLQNLSSKFVRRQGIKYFGRVLQFPNQWQNAWDALGGTEGILQYLSTISVEEVKIVLGKIGACNRGSIRSEAREMAVEELLQAMLPSLYPNARLKSLERRPLQTHVALLLPGCSSQLTADLFASGNESGNVLYEGLFQKQMLTSHGPVVRQYAYRSAFKDGNRYGVDDLLRAFTSREPPKQAEEPKFSTSMSFSVKLLERRVTTTDIATTTNISEDRIYFSLLGRCIKKRISRKRLHEIMALGLKLLELKKEYTSQFSGIQFWSKLTAYWNKSPEDWEDLFVRGLQLGLSGTHKNIGAGFTARRDKDPAREWNLLRLHCLHIPKQGVDIDTESSLEILAKQDWWAGLFKRLELKRAVGLLKKLIEINPQWGFLRSSSQHSIFKVQRITGQENFNAWLLLTELQAGSPDLLEREQAVKRADIGNVDSALTMILADVVL